MEFQFYRLDRQTVNVECSMEHEAIARWANSEIQGNLQKIQDILAVIKQCQNTPHTIDKIVTGKEFSLHINRDEVMVKANVLFDENPIDEEALEDDLQFYDEENMALCGLEDFVHFLESYRQFIQE
ncbi:YacL family protein [Gallibacterium salpingitidis]|uniref:Uncharacterized protein n=1 Tax=Gallibacterium salpingitidis TaxID=505341 RepID=A0A1A7NML9_9PAST|nr:YacL family protein [Gallibacterium salpingitidis]OBW90873.1 hypothetical protein QS62_11330 [Gallibacterium salpingitidis]